MSYISNVNSSLSYSILNRLFYVILEFFCSYAKCPMLTARSAAIGNPMTLLALEWNKKLILGLVNSKGTGRANWCKARIIWKWGIPYERIRKSQVVAGGPSGNTFSILAGRWRAATPVAAAGRRIPATAIKTRTTVLALRAAGARSTTSLVVVTVGLTAAVQSTSRTTTFALLRFRFHLLRFHHLLCW